MFGDFLNRPSDALMNQKPFVYSTRVMLEDIHFGETVFHVAYMRMMDRARAEWLILADSSNSQMHKDGKFLAISQMGVKFFAPAMLEQVLKIETRLHSLSGTGFTFFHEIKDESGQLYCRGEYKMACAIPNGKVYKPGKLKDALPNVFAAAFAATSAAGE